MGREAEQPASTGRTPTTSAEVDCDQCGYDLTGVAIGGDCPECGVPAIRSVGRLRAMTGQQVVAVVLRLAALVLIFQASRIIEIAAWFVFGLLQAPVSVVLNQSNFYFAIVQGIPLTIRLAAAALLLVYARKLAGWLVRSDRQLFALSRLEPAALLSVGLILIGVCSFIYGAGVLTGPLIEDWAAERFSPSRQVPFDRGYASGYVAVAWIVAGLVLILSPGLRRWLGRDL